MLSFNYESQTVVVPSAPLFVLCPPTWPLFSNQSVCLLLLITVHCRAKTLFRSELLLFCPVAECNGVVPSASVKRLALTPLDNCFQHSVISVLAAPSYLCCLPLNNPQLRSHRRVKMAQESHSEVCVVIKAVLECLFLHLSVKQRHSQSDQCASCSGWVTCLCMWTCCFLDSQFDSTRLDCDSDPVT